MDTTFSFRVSEKHLGMDLHTFLSAQFPFLNVLSWNDALVFPILVDNQPVNGNPELTPGTELRFVVRDYQEEPVNLNWRICWENDQLLVVNKPAQLPVHRTTRNIHNTLTALIRRGSPWPEAQPLHRLDQETAGLMVFAKNRHDAQLWQPRFQALLETKVYHAIVYGQPDWAELTFSCRLNTQADSAIRCKMYVVDENENGKLSTTRFRVLSSRGEYSVIECELFTGRKHQLRAQLAHLGHPIVGDKIYAHNGEFFLNRLDDNISEGDISRLQTAHHLLVACQLGLTMGDTEKAKIELARSDFPDAWQSFVQEHNLWERNA